MDINRLRAKMLEKNLNVALLAELMDISKSGLYKKLNRPNTLTIRDVLSIKEILALSDREAIDIFLS